MKKAFRIYTVFIFAIASLLQACGSSQTKEANTVAKASDLYTCSMHPQVLEDHPGDCPICGMKLIKRNATPVALNNIDLETLIKPTNEFVVASLPVTTPREGTINIPVKVYGTIEADTRAMGNISARVSGRIEKLYLRYRFQKVEAGQKVAEIYSPELLTAQQNLLFLLKNDAENSSFISAAKQKLLLLGMSASELNKVIGTGNPSYSVSVYSSYSGHVHDGGMSPNKDRQNMVTTKISDGPVTQELRLKEGMYVSKGQTLFMIVNHHRAWAALQIFPNQQSAVKKGNKVKVIPETDTTAVVNGTVDFIEPFFRNNRRTLTARVYFLNTDMLTIGSQVTANIYTDNKQGLWLPQTAVLSLGRAEVAFLKSEGGFIAHKITTGSRTGGNIQVLSGLNAADTVASNAQYLVDSESFIKAASK